MSAAENRIGRAWRSSIGWLLTDDRWAYVAAGLVFATLILSGMTTSSIGISFLAEDPEHPTAVQLGQPQWIRSDEYNVASPLWMSIMATGDVPTLSTLGAPAGFAHRFPSGGFFETLVYFPYTLLRAGAFLPQPMVFSAVWWMPAIFLVFGLPSWFRRIGGTRRLGWLAALAILFAPSVAWWSLGPLGVLGYTVAGCALLFIAADAWAERRYVRFSLSVLASGILLASIPTVYAPWSLILNVPVLLATLVKILSKSDRAWWARIIPILISGSIAVVFAAGTLLENRDGLQSMVGTVYPGSRRSTALAQPLYALFAAPGADALSRANPDISNASELSSAYTLCAIWAVLLFIAWRRLGSVRENLPLIVLSGFTLIWLGWTMVNAGAVGAALPLLNLVPPSRAAQVVGILTVLVVCLLLSRAPMRPDFRTALVAAAAVALSTGYAVSLLQQAALPAMPTWRVFAAAGGAGLAVFVVTLYPRKLWAIGVAALLALLPVVRSQPVLFGLADFRGTPTAERMLELGRESRADGLVWATDAPSFDSLMLATGVPTLSGFQRSGPDIAQWERLDPERKFEFAWNRGGGYIPFIFTPGEPIDITTSGFDITWVSIDPCDLAERFPELTRIASHQELVSGCLVPSETLTWSGRAVYVYEVR